MRSVKGRIHSIETCGMVDGPGIRFVLFTQGCPLRCIYCHNPDTWKKKGGREVSAGEIIDQAARYKNYMQSSGGGITITGGEPLMQPEFVEALLREARNQGIHSVVDTSGFASPEARRAVYPYADLVLLDIKSGEPGKFKDISGVSPESSFASLDELAELNKPVWIRHVVLPGYTDSLEEAELLADKLSAYNNIERIELLPFHKMGEYKWQELNETYRLNDVSPPSPDRMEALNNIFSRG